MFSSTRPSVLCDHLRIPYDVRQLELPAGCGGLVLPSGRGLHWKADESGPALEHRVGGIRFFAPVCDDEEAARLLGSGWRRTEPVQQADGRPAGSLWQRGDGSIFLPFAPDAAIVAFWSEAYLTALTSPGRQHLRRLATKTYYGARPFLPRSVQIALRRRFARIQERTPFPRWPAETALDDLLHFLLQRLANAAGEAVPMLHAWPDGRSWALVLTHDVETDKGYQALERLRDVELSLSFRSSWNFVPRRYEVDEVVVRMLWAEGFEVGVHGLYHDGRDLESLETLQQRLPEMRRYAERWNATGFRSPATHRHWEWMPLLGFDYDSSYPDTDPFEPQAGGCCSLLPFFNENLVELPLTMAQDHTLFVILRDPDERRWLDKAQFLRERGGLALLNIHPDYMLEKEDLELYGRLLRAFASDSSMWHALPREVSRWWRERAGTSLSRTNGDWVATGPAAERARLVFTEPDGGTDVNMLPAHQV